MGGEVGLAGDLRDVAGSGPDGGDAVGAAGQTAMDENDIAEVNRAGFAGG